MIATSLGSNLAAWLLFPAVLYALALGIGLLVARLLRMPLPNALLAPVGFCVGIVLIQPGYRLGAGGWLGVGLLLAAALAGYLLTGRSLPARLNPGWAGVAGLAAYVIYVAPVAFSGGWTWAGYNFVNDTAVQFLLVDHVQHHGAVLTSLPPSTTQVFLRSYLGSHYPLGSHEILASLDLLTRMPVHATYQAFISGMAGLTAMALATLVRKSGAAAWLAAAVALVAVAANLTYVYALQGNVKEIAMVCTLAVSVAVGRELLTAERFLAPALTLALCMAAAIAVYSAAAVPYMGALTLGLGIGLFLQRRPGLRRPGWAHAGALAAAVVLLAVVALPTLTQIVTFGKVANGTLSSGGAGNSLGQLLRPLELRQAAGIWLDPDYRVPVTSPRLADITDVTVWIALALFAFGIVWLLRRREVGPLLYLAAAALTYGVVSLRVAPYAEGKMLAIASPGVVLLAGMAVVAGLGRRRWWPVAGILGAVVAAGILGSDAMAYHSVRLAPLARIHALSDAGRHLRGRGLVLVNEFEEFAKVFARPARVNTATEALTPLQIQRRHSHGGIYAQQFDLDLARLGYVERFPAILQRRSPVASRPPANYRLIYENRWYEDWVRTSAPQVIDHLPLQTDYDGSPPAPCGDVLALARQARPGDRLVAASGPQAFVFDTATARIRPLGWPPYFVPGQLLMNTPGIVQGTIRMPSPGVYRVWLSGSFGRPLRVYVDGRRVGSAQGIDTPRSWTRVTTLRLAAGVHRVELERPGGGLAPGDGAPSVVGPLVFERTDSRRLESVAIAHARRLCGRRLDWVELVRP